MKRRWQIKNVASALRCPTYCCCGSNLAHRHIGVHWLADSIVCCFSRKFKQFLIKIVRPKTCWCNIHISVRKINIVNLLSSIFRSSFVVRLSRTRWWLVSLLVFMGCFQFFFLLARPCVCVASTRLHAFERSTSTYSRRQCKYMWQSIFEFYSFAIEWWHLYSDVAGEFCTRGIHNSMGTTLLLIRSDEC